MSDQMNENQRATAFENEFETQYYTRAQAAEVLGISEKTVYTYAQNRLIEVAPNPFNVRKEALYIKKSVDRLAQQRQQTYGTNITLNMVAKKFGVSRQYIESLIKRKGIPTLLIEPTDKLTTRVKRVVPEESVTLISELIEESRKKSHKYRKSQYYSSKHRIGLLQLFSDANGTNYRAVKKKSGWGFKSRQLPFIPYEEAGAYNLQPSYDIHLPAEKEDSYCRLNITMQNSQSLQVLDYFYQTKGIENMIIMDVHEEAGDEIYELWVRQSIIDINANPMPHDITLDTLKGLVIAGELIQQENELFIVGDTRKISAVITLENYNHLLAAAEKEETTISALTDKAIKFYFEHHTPKGEK